MSARGDIPSKNQSHSYLIKKLIALWRMHNFMEVLRMSVDEKKKAHGGRAARGALVKKKRAPPKRQKSE